MHVREKIELMIGFAMELAAWMFVGAVGIVILVFVISVGLMILAGIIRCFELLHDAPSYLPGDRTNAPWIPPDHFLD